MATTNRPQGPKSTPSPIPTAKATSTPANPASNPANHREALAFNRLNYLIMLGGIGLLILGFFIMSQDKEPFGFGVLGLTVGPIIVMLGFITEFVAILYRPKKREVGQ